MSGLWLYGALVLIEPKLTSRCSSKFCGSWKTHIYKSGPPHVSLCVRCFHSAQIGSLGPIEAVSCLSRVLREGKINRESIAETLVCIEGGPEELLRLAASYRTVPHVLKSIVKGWSVVDPDHPLSEQLARETLNFVKYTLVTSKTCFS